MNKHPKTEKIFIEAYSQTLPDSNEDWGSFSDIIQRKMEKMERENIKLRDLLAKFVKITEDMSGKSAYNHNGLIVMWYEADEILEKS